MAFVLHISVYLTKERLLLLVGLGDRGRLRRGRFLRVRTLGQYRLVCHLPLLRVPTGMATGAVRDFYGEIA